MSNEYPVATLSLDLPDVPGDWSEKYIHSKRVVGLARWAMQDTLPFAHRVSDLVLRKAGDKYILAAYICSYKTQDLNAARLRRPSKWLAMDIVTGAVLQVIDCDTVDFSEAEFTGWYNVNMDDETSMDVGDEHYRMIYSVLDSVRRGVLSGQPLDTTLYMEYMDGILRNTPPGYRQFLQALSDPEGKKPLVDRVAMNAEGGQET